MEKQFTYRGVSISVLPTSSHGLYQVSADYRGKSVKAYTNDSMSYDYCNDDTPEQGITRTEAKRRMMDARRSLYHFVKGVYEAYYTCE